MRNLFRARSPRSLFLRASSNRVCAGDERIAFRSKGRRGVRSLPGRAAREVHGGGVNAKEVNRATPTITPHVLCVSVRRAPAPLAPSQCPDKQFEARLLVFGRRRNVE